MRNLMLRRVIGDREARLGYIAAMNNERGGDGGDGGSGDNGSPGEDQLQAIASRFIDLWQRQMEIMAEDPALREWMNAYTNLGAQTEAAVRGAQTEAAVRGAQTEAAVRGAREDGNPDDDSGDKGPSGAPAGATTGAKAAQPASRQRGGELDELTRRLAACEERRAQLERAAGTASGSAGKRTRKAKS